MKVWISKYALTEGIVERDDAMFSRDIDYVKSKESFTDGSFFYRIGVQAHLSRESAIEAAEQMRLKKIKSLQKQLANLEAMKF
jgi:hypothetical protein